MPMLRRRMRVQRFGIASLAIVAVIAIGVVSQSFAAPITGTNSVLSGLGGKVYVPMQNSTSGTLSPTNSPDTITLGYTFSTMKGSVSLVYGFNLSSVLGSGKSVDPANSQLFLTFSDLNFQTETRNTFFGYTETLGLTFLKDGTMSVPVTPGLLIDSTNYGSYRPDGFGSTANTTVTYAFTLAQLGVTADDLTNVNADKEFGLGLTIKSAITHSRNGADSLTQTQESVGPANFTLVVLPEPATMSLLSLGGLALIKRRKQSALNPTTRTRKG